MTTATHIAYYHVCHRKLWLFHHGIQMEHTSDTVAEGKLIGETTYPQRAAKYTELAIGSIKIDFWDAKAKIVHEVKKSPKMEDAHIWQVKYYLLVLEENGIIGATGLLEYPKLRQTTPVYLEDEDREYLRRVRSDIQRIIASETVPPRLTNKTFCKQCSYFEFCWSE